jgi:hypothetical protein
MHPGGLVFEDAYPSESEKRVLQSHLAVNRTSVLPGGSSVRASTAIDRGRNIVKRFHLFSTETISPLVSFEGELRGNLSETQERLLQSCCLILTHFGSGAARGPGLCHYSVGAPREEA